ncbi:flagellin [Nibricoccus aquaticus]|uniref:Flagellin n=1 Tax=Nibricoccus aquaticus TaxID=2576891 RepID=A0A290QFK7_9BACT|nr:flagellin [Nibricoccus aquaticus]ATC64118.1 flagellin [Nibricoccus aquaticus]
MSATPINTQTLQDARNISRMNTLLDRSIARLSSGSRMVAASDDPAGSALAEKLSAQNLRVGAASTNVQNAVSFTQSVDGFLDGMGDLLGRMSELAILARDPLKNAGDLALYQQEFEQLQTQIRNTIGGNTTDIGGTYNITKPFGTFNGRTLFGANPAGTVIATGQASTQRLTIPETNLRDGAMLSMFQQDAAGVFTMSVTDAAAIGNINSAIGEIADERSTLGAVGGRLELVASALASEGESLTSTISKISDIDVATESTRMAKYDLLTKSGTAMLTQANQSTRSVLRLLQG